MPEQMLGYRAASFFARMFCPEAMMGLQTTEEIYDASPVTATPSAKDLSDAILSEGSTKKTAAKNSTKAEEPVAEEAPAKIICEKCGSEVKGEKKYTAEQIAAMSKDKYGKTLCVDCAKKAKAEAEKKAYDEAVAETSAPQGDLAAELLEEAKQ